MLFNSAIYLLVALFLRKVSKKASTSYFPPHSPVMCNGILMRRTSIGDVFQMLRLHRSYTTLSYATF